MTDEQIARTIWHDALQCSDKLFKWQFSQPSVIEQGTAFNTNTAKVMIQAQENAFTITIILLENNETRKYRNIPLGDIITTIDQVIGMSA